MAVANEACVVLLSSEIWDARPERTIRLEGPMLTPWKVVELRAETQQLAEVVNVELNIVEQMKCTDLGSHHFIP